MSKPKDNECEWAPEVSEEDEPTKGKLVGVDEETSVASELKASINRIKRLISRNHLLEAYQFNQDDLLMIAEICHRAIEHGDQDFNMKDICEMLPKQKGASEGRLNSVVNLIDREILTAPCLREHDFHYDPRSLYSTFLRLNGLLWNLILGKDPLQYASRIFNKAKSEDAIDTILKMIDAFFLHYPELDDSSPAEAGVCFGRSVNIALDAFLAKFDESNDPIWKAFKAKHRLNRFWLKSLLLIHYLNQYRDTEPIPEVIASLLAHDCRERLNYVDLLGRHNVLAQKGLINPRIPVFSNYRMELTDDAITLMHGKANSSNTQAINADQLLDRSPYLNRINPAQTLDQLIVDSQTKSIIVSVINRLKNPRLESFAQWGLVGASLTNDPDIQHGCNILLHGVPGTGKTYIAGVFANELKRSLIQINANSIRGMFYGESEKQAREMFQEMRTLAKSKSPVFLLNEGDQLIHQRMAAAERSVDHAENTIQSIFLE
ncbi:MAG TPA: ATP-binding protein, partial [Candidatus Cloacimonadota bacterium]|nr:ATP-binding protein [Candidatus Cloacimonadota bacterium]